MTSPVASSSERWHALAYVVKSNRVVSGFGFSYALSSVSLLAIIMFDPLQVCLVLRLICNQKAYLTSLTTHCDRCSSDDAVLYVDAEIHLTRICTASPSQESRFRA